MIDFNKDIILENDVVLLRPLTTADISNLSHFSEEEPDLWKFSLLPANGIENLTKYIAVAITKREQQTAYPFIVYDKRTKQYAGSTRFYDIQAHHSVLSIGYTWYGKQFQGTGLNKNCKYLMLAYAFDNLKVERVEFRADAKNARSIAAMKSIGCQVEGILRSNCKSLTGRRDSIVMSILQNEWKSQIKSQLRRAISS